VINISKACEELFEEEFLKTLPKHRLKEIKKSLHKQHSSKFVQTCSCLYPCYTDTPNTNPELFDLVKYSFYKQNLYLVYKYIADKNQIEGSKPVYRNRRGKLVQVPPKWVNNFTTKETIRQRPSKLLRKVKRSLTKNTENFKDQNIPTQKEF
jgi:hypothetical protein